MMFCLCIFMSLIIYKPCSDSKCDKGADEQGLETAFNTLIINKQVLEGQVQLSLLL